MAQADDFRIEPDDLLAVARQVEDLLDDISGNNGNVTGNQTEFVSGSDPSHLVAALSSVYPEIGQGSAYVEAYGWESKGLNEKYKSIVGQLERLAAACRSTAEGYGAADANTQQAATALDGSMSGGPGGTTGQGGI